MSVLSRWLQHPHTRDLELDDPRTTELRHRIVQEKKFLRRLYEEWYGLLVAHLSGLDDILELGSGAGFLKDFIPSLITSDVFETPGVDRVVDARRLPFQDDSLDAIVMIDVFHHLPEVNLFFEEAKRCLRDGGRSSWSSLGERLGRNGSISGCTMSRLFLMLKIGGSLWEGHYLRPMERYRGLFLSEIVCVSHRIILNLKFGPFSRSCPSLTYCREASPYGRWFQDGFILS